MAETSRESERQLAARFFNETWSLLDKGDRTADDDLVMIHSAHASRRHWQDAGGPENWAVGEWQLARVYAVLGRAEPALYHARACLRLSTEHNLSPFHLGCAHEAMARALATTSPVAALKHKTMASDLAKTITDAEDRAILESDLAMLVIEAK